MAALSGELGDDGGDGRALVGACRPGEGVSDEVGAARGGIQAIGAGHGDGAYMRVSYCCVKYVIRMRAPEAPVWPAHCLPLGARTTRESSS